MKFCVFHIIIVLCLASCESLFAQKERYSEYYQIRKNYEGFSENDARALPFIRRYIAEAKRNRNYNKLYQGYADGVEFSSDRDIKLCYADSTILAAKLSRNESLISSAYLEKGVVYYFHFKKFKLALDEFLVAVHYAKNQDAYYQNRLYYLIGVVKNYMGYYDQALDLFIKTRTHFACELQKNQHPNILYDCRRGYYNSLHQMAISYRNLENFQLADSITTVGLKDIGASKEHRQEAGYFFKEKGISEFRKKEYSTAIATLSSSTVALSKINDFSWMAVNYSYLGKSYLGLGDHLHAVKNLEKVDSIFQKHNFIVPEERDTYELLINHFKANNNFERQLYYTNQLLKIDEILLKDFSYLSRKMNGEYDTKELKENQKRLERKSNEDKVTKWSLGSVAVTFGVSLLFYMRRQQRILEKYKILERKILARDKTIQIKPEEQQTDRAKLGIDPKLIETILKKLQDFEEKQAFREHGLTLHKLAARFETNHYYLSQIVNEYKGMNFAKYLSELRISYITNKLYNDNTYLKYTVETLAEDCGMASRNHFAKLFRDINGIFPSDFINKRLSDIKKQGVDKP